MTRTPFGSLLLAAIVGLSLQEPGGTLDVAPGPPRIEDLTARREDDRIVASFRVDNAFHEETLERIQSGIPVTFKHRLRVVAKRALPLMPAKELGRTRIEARVTYDALTGQYSLVREFDFRTKKDLRQPKQQELSTTSDAEMRRWLTEFSDVPVYDPDPAADDPLDGAKLRLRVDSNLGRKFVLLIFRTTRGDSAEIALEP